MIRVWIVGLWSIGLCGGVMAWNQPPAQQPAFRAGTALVTIDALVQRRGKPVTTLTATDFELLDNGVRQQISLEATEAVPVDVTMVFDEWYYAVHSTGRLRPDLIQIAEKLRPIDRLRVIIFATEVREALPMQAPDAWLSDGLPELTARPTAARVGRPSADSIDVFYDPTLRHSAVSDALLFALARPPQPGRRHLVVVMATGLDRSVRSFRFPLSAIAARSDALLQIGLLSFRGGGTWPYQPETRFLRADLGAAAEATGGEVRPAPDAVSAFKEILDDLHQSYLLRYTVTGIPSGGWHTVLVTTPKFPDYTIRARSGYLGR